MSQDRRKLCVVCAWGANCAKRFGMAGDVTLHCPDFTEDVSLRRQAGTNELAENLER